jgi:hypothetical protein
MSASGANWLAGHRGIIEGRASEKLIFTILTASPENKMSNLWIILLVTLLISCGKNSESKNPSQDKPAGKEDDQRAGKPSTVGTGAELAEALDHASSFLWSAYLDDPGFDERRFEYSCPKGGRAIMGLDKGSDGEEDRLLIEADACHFEDGQTSLMLSGKFLTLLNGLVSHHLTESVSLTGSHDEVRIDFTDCPADFTWSYQGYGQSGAGTICSQSFTNGDWEAPAPTRMNEFESIWNTTRRVSNFCSFLSGACGETLEVDFIGLDYSRPISQGSGRMSVEHIVPWRDGAPLAGYGSFLSRSSSFQVEYVAQQNLIYAAGLDDFGAFDPTGKYAELVPSDSKWSYVDGMTHDTKRQRLVILAEGTFHFYDYSTNTWSEQGASLPSERYGEIAWLERTDSIYVAVRNLGVGKITTLRSYDANGQNHTSMQLGMSIPEGDLQLGLTPSFELKANRNGLVLIVPISAQDIRRYQIDPITASVTRL